MNDELADKKGKQATVTHEFAKDQETENMLLFKSYCCQAYHHLR